MIACDFFKKTLKRNISPLLFLTPRLPGFLVGRRLTSHALELLQLDRALSKLGPHQLSDSEVRQVQPLTSGQATCAVFEGQLLTVVLSFAVRHAT